MEFNLIHPTRYNFITAGRFIDVDKNDLVGTFEEETGINISQNCLGQNQCGITS